MFANVDIILTRSVSEGFSEIFRPSLTLRVVMFPLPAAGSAAIHAAQSEAVELTHRLHALGQYINASPLHPISTATCVRIRDEKRLVTDGPFAETREFLCGFDMVQARDLNTVIPIAAQHPGARLGTVEVRRLYDIPNL